MRTLLIVALIVVALFLAVYGVVDYVDRHFCGIAALRADQGAGCEP